MNRSFASEELLELLHALMDEPLLEGFALAGGSALACHLQHRRSVDIDMFSIHSFDSRAIRTLFVDKYHASRIYEESDTVGAVINDIKIDCLTHSYPLLCALQNIDGIRVYALQDLAAMKLNAISGRGTKKDYWDVGILLEHHSLQEMIGFFRQKYSVNDTWHLLKALNEIDAADHDPTPLHSLTDISWDKIKLRIRLELRKII